MPHSLQGPLREKVVAGAFVDTSKVHDKKMKALSAHASQQGWLEASQGMNSYLKAAEEMSIETGKLSKRFKHAEGWRRHLHFGFSRNEIDPLSEALGVYYMVNPVYERKIVKGI